MKLSACMIVRDCGPSLDKAISSIRPHVDEIVLVDTGSKEPRRPDGVDVFEVFTDCNAKQDCPKEWPCGCKAGQMLDFAFARNRSFALATGDYVTWLDADDEVFQADTTSLRSLIRPGECVWFPYQYAYDASGNCILMCWRHRLVPRTDRFTWSYPIHEDLAVWGLTRSDKFVWRHMQQKGRHGEDGKTRNLRIAMHWTQVLGASGEALYARDNRFWFYLAQSLQQNDRNVQAAGAFEKAWELENDQAVKFTIAQRLAKLSSPTRAVEWGWAAVKAQPDLCDAWFALANALYLQADEAHRAGQWTLRYKLAQQIIRFIEIGKACPPPDTYVFTEPVSWDTEVNYGLMLAWVDRTEDAARAAEEALKKGHDERLANNLKSYRAYFTRRKIETGLEELRELEDAARRARQFGRPSITEAEIGIAQKSLDSFGRTRAAPWPRGVADKVASKLEQRIEAATDRAIKGLGDVGPKILVAGEGDSRLDITFALPAGIETWNPETAETSGIAGSEMALIELSKRFARKGHRVTVFSPSCGPEKTYGDVRYIPQLVPHGTCADVFVAWKVASLLERAGYVANKKILWVHDTCAWELTAENMKLADRVAVQSEFHKTTVMQQGIPAEKFWVTRSGIDTKRFRGPTGPSGRRKVAVYTSSPDRGLEQLLEVWPDIEKGAPGAELEIFYGFNNWDKFAEMSGDVAVQERIRKIKTTIDELPSVHLMGRLPRQEYISRLLSAKAWFYPAWHVSGGPFHETSCVAILEAWAARLRLVCPSWGALSETGEKTRATFYNRQKWVDGYEATDNIWDSKAFTRCAREVLLSNSLGEEPDDRFDWSGVADEWLAMLTEKPVVKEKSRVLPRYEGVL